MKLIFFIGINFLFFNQITAQKSSIVDGKTIEELDSMIWGTYYAGDYVSAELYAVESRNLAANKYGKEDTIYALATCNLGILYNALQRLPEAEIMLVEAMKIQKKVLGKEHIRYLTSAGTLAYLYTSAQRYPEAESLLKETVAIQKKVLGREDATYAAGVFSLAALYYYMGKYEESEPYYFEAIKSFTAAYGRENLNTASAMSSLAALYQQIGRYEEAEVLCLDAKDIYEKTIGREHAYYAGNLVNLGVIYNYLKKYKEAELLYLEAKNAFLKTVGQEHSSYLMCLNNLATVYGNLENLGKAEELLNEVLKIRARTQGVTHPDYLLSLNNLALVYERKKEYEAAEKLLIQVKNARAKAIGTKHSLYAETLVDLGVVYGYLERYKEAEELFLEAEQIQLQALHDKHPFYVEVLNELARLYRNSGAYEKGIDYCLLALKQNLNTKETVTSHTFLLTTTDIKTWANFDYISSINAFNSIRNLAVILQKKGELELSYLITRVGIDISERTKISFLAEENKLTALKSTIDLLSAGICKATQLQEKTNKTNNNYLEEAFQLAEINKSTILEAAVKAQRARVFGDLPDSLAQKEQQIQQNLDKLNKQLYHHEQGDPQKNILQVQINELSLNADQFKKLLKEQYPKYYNTKYKTSSISVADIQALLDDKTALLEYFIKDTVAYLFYIDKHKIASYRLNTTQEEIETQTSLLRSVLTNYNVVKAESQKAFNRFNNSASWFYEKLLSNALQEAKGIKDLIIVPDGVLGNLPFEVFLVEAGSPNGEAYEKLHYLINDYTISYNYSAFLWKESKLMPTSTAPKGLLALASDYAQPDSNYLMKRSHLIVKQRKNLDLLPAANNEVLMLSKSYDGLFLQGKNATERFFKDNAGEYKVIHLAMHGLLNEHYPILSSMVFTEDGDSIEDNFLQAYEISHLKLNADLVVLSACETGYGRFKQGEGVLSLARSFMYAGVPSLVVSLWQVNDFTTATIMKTFYEGLASGMSKDEALRQAKLHFLSKTKGVMAHPVFWSAFIQIGDNRPVDMGGGFVWWQLFLGVGVALVFLGAMLVFRKRKIATKNELV